MKKYVKPDIESDRFEQTSLSCNATDYYNNANFNSEECLVDVTKDGNFGGPFICSVQAFQAFDCDPVVNPENAVSLLS